MAGLMRLEPLPYADRTDPLASAKVLTSPPPVGYWSPTLDYYR